VFVPFEQCFLQRKIGHSFEESHNYSRLREVCCLKSNRNLAQYFHHKVMDLYSYHALTKVVFPSFLKWSNSLLVILLSVMSVGFIVDYYVVHFDLVGILCLVTVKKFDP
jgi:hypothetical protein